MSATPTDPPTALVFPGQGSQQEGMARPWRDHPAFARWAEADTLLGRDVSRLGLEADTEELREPVNCQLALFVHHTVLLEALRDAAGLEPVAVAGHSLGEYNALHAAGVLGFADALRLVEARAEQTQKAAQQNPGTMVACLGFDDALVHAAAERCGAAVANANAPGQLTVAGTQSALDALAGELSELRGKVVPLEVGAAYHSPHMQPALEPFGHALDEATFAPARTPVVANVDAAAHTDAEEWPRLLRRQLVSPVRWTETVQALAALGVERVVELGASPVLSAMIKRIDRAIERLAVTTPAELEALT